MIYAILTWFMVMIPISWFWSRVFKIKDQKKSKSKSFDFFDKDDQYHIWDRLQTSFGQIWLDHFVVALSPQFLVGSSFDFERVFLVPVDVVEFHVVFLHWLEVMCVLVDYSGNDGSNRFTQIPVNHHFIAPILEMTHLLGLTSGCTSFSHFEG
jgi:hypothetical protein